jgi:cation:H+ antiporter
MILSIAYLLIGIVLILVGADRLTVGASAFARRLHVNELVIGLTVVAFGTSMPEFVTSLFASVRGSADLSIGNIVGSNIFNVLAIMGISALIAPVKISKTTLVKDIPFGILASAMLIVVCFDSFFGTAGTANVITRGDGLILLGFFAVFMWYTMSIAKNGMEGAEVPAKQIPMAKTVLFIVLGLGFLILGGDLFVRGASDIARVFGVSEAVIGLTIVAGGTSLPELATSVLAAYRGHSDLAIGNVVGSNIFNIFWILGFCGLISPMTLSGITAVDMFVMLGSMVLLWLFCCSRSRVSRAEGAVMFALYVGYTTYLIINA